MNNTHECPVKKWAEEIRDAVVKDVVIYMSLLSCEACLREKRRGHLKQSFELRGPECRVKISQQGKRYLSLPEDGIIDTFAAAIEYSFKPSGKHHFHIRREVLQMVDPRGS